MKHKYNKRPRRGLKLFFGIVLLFVSAALLIAPSLLGFEKWHDLDTRLITESGKGLCIYDRDGSLLSVLGSEKRIWVSIDGLQKHTVDAFIAAEDNRFYSHKGVDVYRIFGAAWADIKARGYVQGASTISQQLIKLSHLSSEKTIGRKAEEAVLAIMLEKEFSKSEILEMYLNYIYFGKGLYGIEAASLGYFGVHACDLTAAQSAQLAGILKSPSAYSPHIAPEASLKRRDHIIGLMYEQGFLSEKEADEARAEKCVLSSALPVERSAAIDLAVNEAVNVLGITREDLLSGGYSVYTTISGPITEECELLFADPSTFPSENAQGAVVVLDPHGGIEAMIGARGEYDPSGLNRAVDAERQPGSLIKPVLVYAPALELFGYSPTTQLTDEPMTFGDYSPRNSDDKYYGRVTLRTAVTRSLNIPAVKVLNDVGLTSAVAFAERLGIRFDGEQIGLPLALGGFTHGVTVLEMAGAYSAFANGGVYIEPSAISSIRDRYGTKIYERPLSGVRAMSRENAYLLTSMLKSVACEGTGKRLAETGLPLAAKTGTSVDDNGVRDAWCAVYTRDHSAVVWMGTDSSDKGSLPSDAVGGKEPAILLGRLFEYIYKDRQCADFEKPESVEEMRIDARSEGKDRIYLASGNTPEEYVRNELFRPGEAPSESDPYWTEPSPPEFIGWSTDAFGAPVISFIAESPSLIYRVKRASGDGSETVVAEFTGEDGLVSCRDSAAVPGAQYDYFVTALHPEAGENGKRPESGPSNKVRVYIPFR